MNTKSRIELALEFDQLPENALVDENTVSAALGVTVRMLQDQRQVHKTGIKVTRINRLVRYRKSDVLAYVEQCRNTGAAA